VFWECKSSFISYKRGREGTCKRIQTFGYLCNLQRELQSLCSHFVLECVKNSLSRVRGIIRIFRVTPQQSSGLIFDFCCRFPTQFVVMSLYSFLNVHHSYLYVDQCSILYSELLFLSSNLYECFFLDLNFPFLQEIALTDSVA
jgi:hypothetical protein